MSKPPYLTAIDDIARDLGVSKTYESKLLEAWSSFESVCKGLTPEYDILRRDLESAVLTRMEDFVTLLYANDDSSPQADCDQIREKDAAYGGSWHSRGGTGAFHALARKGDRIVSMFNKHGSLSQCRKDTTNSESIDDTLGDLRRYLILVLAWHRTNPAPTPLLDAVLAPPPINVMPNLEAAMREPEATCRCSHAWERHDIDETPAGSGCLFVSDAGDYCGCKKFIAA